MPIGREFRLSLSEDHYRIHRSTNNMTVLIPCHLGERLFVEGNNLTITLRACSESSPSTDHALDPGHPGLMMRNPFQPTRM